MFSSLRQDSLLYVIDKNGDMSYSVLKNIKVSAPYQEFKTAYPMPNASMLVDVEGEVEGKTVKLTKLPASLSTHEYNGVFVTETREAVQSELEALAAKSNDELKRRSYHENVVAFCERTLPLVNPNIARDKANSERMDSLEKDFKEMKAVLSEMNVVLKSLKTPQQ